MKVRVFGESAAVDTAVPVPLSVTVCVEFATLFALSVTVTVAVRVPAAEGLNVTEMTQFAPARRLLPQLFVCE